MSEADNLALCKREDTSMMNREIYLNSISDSLALLSRQVAVHNAINLYDMNIVAESFYSGLLNLIEDLHLTNVNAIEKNAPGIDLVDEENKIAIQVTSDNTSNKIKHTIKEFLENKLYEKYDRLVILLLVNKPRYSVEFDTKGMFVFEKNQDIWGVEDLIKKVNALPTERLKKINEYLQTELNDKYEKIDSTEATEVETIIDLIEFISGHKKKYKPRKVVVDPGYKIFNRFKEFAQNLLTQYKTLFEVYGLAMNEIEKTLERDEAQDLITVMYLQDISIQYLDKANNDPVRALNLLVDFFAEKLSKNGKKYDHMAIKFYLINEMIKCSVFPNERSE